MDYWPSGEKPVKIKRDAEHPTDQDPAFVNRDRGPRRPKSSRVHLHLLKIVPRLETDYVDHGGKVERWKDPMLAYPDCSCDCKFAQWLADMPQESLSADWLVCTNPDGPRKGLLTFEHQAGFECFVPNKRQR